MANLMPFGGNNRSVDQPDRFEVLDNNTRYKAAQIKSQGELDSFGAHLESALAEQAISHTADLVEHAMERCRRTPEAAAYLEPILRGFANNAARRVSG